MTSIVIRYWWVIIYELLKLVKLTHGYWTIQVLSQNGRNHNWNICPQDCRKIQLLQSNSSMLLFHILTNSDHFKIGPMIKVNEWFSHNMVRIILFLAMRTLSICSKQISEWMFRLDHVFVGYLEAIPVCCIHNINKLGQYGLLFIENVQSSCYKICSTF